MSVAREKAKASKLQKLFHKSLQNKLKLKTTQRNSRRCRVELTIAPALSLFVQKTASEPVKIGIDAFCFYVYTCLYI